MSQVAAGKYRPNLSGFMTICETNYMLMQRLLAGQESAGAVRSFQVSDDLCYRLQVLEVARYTSLVGFEQLSDLACGQVAKLLLPAMQVRLYHDARMAEVVTSQHIRQIKPRYDYPNRDMHQPDEKRQVNNFLKEWLQMCLNLGQVSVPLPGQVSR